MSWSSTILQCIYYKCVKKEVGIGLFCFSLDLVRTEDFAWMESTASLVTVLTLVLKVKRN